LDGRTFRKNVQEGVASLQKGKEIIIYDDGRGFELALEIKRSFILEYEKQLAEKIKINSAGDTITISMK